MYRKNRKQFTTLAIIFALFLAFFASGCATTKPMALSEKTETLDLAQESIALITLKTSNVYKPSCQPQVLTVSVWTRGEEKREKYTFRADKPCRQVEKQFNEYLISLRLPPGHYQLREILGGYYSFLVNATCTIPVYANFELEPNEVVYLGRIEAINRKRKDDSELRAGPIVPLIDQAVTGFSTGTFDIKIYDNYNEDLPVFSQKCPVLGTCTVEKMPLPPWKKPSKQDME